MRRSVLFARLFSVVAAMILMTALITAGIYNFIAQSLFTRIKEDELLPKARALARAMATYAEDGEELGNAFRSIASDQAGVNLLGAYLVAVDGAGEEIFSDRQLEQYRNNMVEAARLVLTQGGGRSDEGFLSEDGEEGLRTTLRQTEMRTAEIPALSGTPMVGVGVRVTVGAEPRGAVLMVVPLLEAMFAMGSLNWALLLSLGLSLPLMTVVLYYVVGRVVNPLRQMTGIANKMSAGDFSQRADMGQRGEVGELGAALNYLSQELSLTISTLMLERNRLRQTINGLNEGIVAVDKAARVTHVNPAVGLLFAPCQDAGGEDERMRVIPDALVWSDFERVVNGGEAVSRMIATSWRTVMMDITPIHDEQGEIAGAVGRFADVTERERLERTRRDYVANVSHEMRTPLTAMRALVEPLSEGMVSSEETRGRYYGILLRETMRLSRLIDDLMELSRLQSGALSLNVEKVRLQDIFEGMQAKYEPVAGERGLRFVLNDALNETPAAMSNPDRVEQVLVILIDNAMKYTPEGGSVTLSADWDERKIVLSVSDTGVGIAPEDQPYVFERFYKVDRAHSGLGSGLGLSIARELLRLMGEEISLQSEQGRGSVFRFTLRRA